MTTRFTGFPTETFTFLRALARHNDRDWFTAHRDAYDDACVEPTLAFIEAVGPRVKALSPGIEFDAKLGGSLLRIHRDVRFSRDAKPFKDYLDVWFWRGEDKGRDAPSFCVRLYADRIVVGAGIRVLVGEQLAAYREAVDANKTGRKLAAVVEDLCTSGRYSLTGKQLARVPSGYAADHPRSDLLRRTGLFVCREGPVGKTAGTARFASECVEHFAAMAPVCRWLTAVA